MSMDSERIGIMFYHYIEKGGCFMEKSVAEKNKRVILVSGMSGAGKSVATRSLEDIMSLIIFLYNWFHCLWI